MKKIMKEKNQVVPDEVLSKEFLSQFKTEADVSKFLKQLHAQVLEKMLEGEMDAHLGYEKNSVAGNNSGNSRNGSYPKKIQTEHGEAVISIPRNRNGQFEPIAVPKHESRGLSIEKLVISLYAKGMSVSDIEEEMREIYEIELSTSAISILRGISIRMPLLIYGAELSDENHEITIDNFASLIDPQSWEEFMPKGVTKQKFNSFKKYYDPEIFCAPRTN